MIFSFALLFLATHVVSGKHCWVASEWKQTPFRTQRMRLLPVEEPALRLNCPNWADYCLCNPDLTESKRLNCIAFTWEVCEIKSIDPNYSDEPQKIEYTETEMVSLSDGASHRVTVTKSEEVTETFEIGADVFGVSLAAKAVTQKKRVTIDDQATTTATEKAKGMSTMKKHDVPPNSKLIFFQVHYYLPTPGLSWFFEKPELDETQRIGASIPETVANSIHQDPVKPSCSQGECSIPKHLKRCGSLPTNICIQDNGRQCIKKMVDLPLDKIYLGVCEYLSVGDLDARKHNEKKELDLKNENPRRGMTYENQFVANEKIVTKKMKKTRRDEETIVGLRGTNKFIQLLEKDRISTRIIGRGKKNKLKKNLN